MKKDDIYYEDLDKELTASVPTIDMRGTGSLGTAYANIVVLAPEDMSIAQSLASQSNTTVNDFLSSTIREQLVLRLA